MSQSTRHAARPPGPGAVSDTAERFAAKVRDRRRRRLIALVAAGVVLLGTGWLALLSPWATVQEIEVARTVPAAQMAMAPQRLSDDDLRAQAEEELGRPMLTARADDVAARLERLPLVGSATVTRSWPSGLVLTVTERRPVAALPAAKGTGKGLVLVDIDGVQLGRVAAVPSGLPRLDVDLQEAGAASLQACLAMLAQLPEEIEGRLRSIGADSPDGITLKLTDGATVEWGDASSTARKAQVLQALLRQKAVMYDVRSPDTPAIRKG